MQLRKQITHKSVSKYVRRFQTQLRRCEIGRNRILCKTNLSSPFIKNRTNMHEMQNRMKIAFCVKPPLLSILLVVKEAPREVFGGGGGSSVGIAPARVVVRFIVGP